MQQKTVAEAIRPYAGEIDAQTEGAFERYLGFLTESNRAVNLTAITDRDEIIVKHFADSVAGQSLIPQGAKMLDIGSGAGFPAVPIKLIREDVDLTMLESIGKKTSFLQRLGTELGLTYRVVQGRAEDEGHGAMRATFDVVTARAVTALRVLIEYAVPFLKEGGVLIAYKGSGADDEIKEAAGALRALNAEVEDVRRFTLDGQYARALIVIRKKGATRAEYPRAGAKIKKKPL
ncbi:MAG TPA: 16S rRNA (guanine(527)-N(7))-methyltransferase RsmG [Candidatus Stercoripulliclostridium merdipullorum]|uniref:Ribosomal RNA small subunit methyltransferase G n=1 Tax=Candidatus Stercoripulliclostridium merdipullorum TaxID=2840952 RepID=A0A9D1NAM7_9FIRM|nr:16S rRNA (guanine(527)-N(7))-methyltransferase RsmG [Candidatus Stercoripulliclostridium merdipullorum]